MLTSEIFVAKNLKYLRKEKALTQEQLARELIITRVSLASYESQRNDPPIPVLKRISKFFHISIDILINVDLTKVSLDAIMKLDGNRILLPITIDKNGKDFIEIVPQKASAGYLNGYSDPEYIGKLHRFQLPFMGQGKYRAFPIQGDSMPPLLSGSYVIGKYIEQVAQIKEGNTYIVITSSDGIVYKRLYPNQKEAHLLMVSDNTEYESYQVHLSEIIEVWEFTCSINMEDAQQDKVSMSHMMRLMKQMQSEMEDIKQHQSA